MTFATRGFGHQNHRPEKYSVRKIGLVRCRLDRPLHSPPAARDTFDLSLFSSGELTMPALFSPRLHFQTAALFLLTPTCLMSQQPPDRTPTPSTKPAQEKPQPKPDESATASAALLQINNALEGLAARVGPAVVQILVTGYGPLHEDNRTQTALIVRQHAVGSGVIVDSNGYIMTNAHLVAGAQRIRLALPLPTDTGPPVPAGKRRIPEARL